MFINTSHVSFRSLSGVSVFGSKLRTVQSPGVYQHLQTKNVVNTAHFACVSFVFHTVGPVTWPRLRGLQKTVPMTARHGVVGSLFFGVVLNGFVGQVVESRCCFRRRCRLLHQCLKS